MTVPGGPSADARVYSSMEHDRIRAACSLSEAEYAVMCPPVYATILLEGRTMNKIDGVLNQYLKPDYDDDDPVDIFVTSDMVRDMKDLRFGYQGDTSYATCHRGLTIFAVVSVDQEEVSARKRARERAAKVTFLTSADVMSMESAPDTCPTTYEPMMRLLSAYKKYLVVHCGKQCSHYLGVVEVRRAIAINRQWYQNASARTIVEIIWAIFVDGRKFFGAKIGRDGRLPESSLVLMKHNLERGHVIEGLSCPWQKLTAGSDQVTDEGGRSNYNSAAGAMSNLLGNKRQATTKSVNKVNGNFNSLLKKATKSLVLSSPAVTMAEVMSAASPSLTYEDVKLGLAGSCLDMHYFGRCVNPQCTYQHKAAQPELKANRVRNVLDPLRKAVKAYEEQG